MAILWLHARVQMRIIYSSTLSSHWGSGLLSQMWRILVVTFSFCFFLFLHLTPLIFAGSTGVISFFHFLSFSFSFSVFYQYHRDSEMSLSLSASQVQAVMLALSKPVCVCGNRYKEQLASVGFRKILLFFVFYWFLLLSVDITWHYQWICPHIFTICCLGTMIYWKPSFSNNNYIPTRLGRCKCFITDLLQG